MMKDLETRVSHLEERQMDSEKWQAHHDGWVKAEWKGQWVRNKDVETRMRVVEKTGQRLAVMYAIAVFIATVGAQLLIARIT